MKTSKLESVATYPSRLVCLTEETTETLYRLGEGDRVVGVSGFTVRPKEARRKPKVSTYLEADFDKIVALRPDVVLAFSDLQADLTAELIRRGLMVVTFNQRSVAEIFQSICMLGGLIGCADKAERLVSELQTGLESVKSEAAKHLSRPRVFFEEWPDPLISAIRWVDELMEIAGAESCFPELRAEQGARGRIVTPEEVLARRPDCIFASWCGRKVKKEVICSRPGWSDLPALREGHVYEIESSIILQPGPAALTDGVQKMARIVADWARGRGPSREVA